MKPPRLTLSNSLWLVFAAVYFFLPLYATAEFSLETGPSQHGFDAYTAILSDPEFKDGLRLSLQLAVETVILSLVLLVPTVYWFNLKLPGLRPAMDFIAILPFVVPPVALAVGLFRVFQPVTWLISTPQVLVLAYVVLTLPFTYRSLDAGMRAINLRTLTEAAQSVGAGGLTILLRVILPNVRSAMLSATFLGFTLVLGEYTMASLLIFNTFAVYVERKGVETAHPAAALAIISFILTWAAMMGFLLLGRRLGPRQQTQIGTTR